MDSVPAEPVFLFSSDSFHCILFGQQTGGLLLMRTKRFCQNAVTGGEMDSRRDRVTAVIETVDGRRLSIRLSQEK